MISNQMAACQVLVPAEQSRERIWLLTHAGGDTLSLRACGEEQSNHKRASFGQWIAQACEWRGSWYIAQKNRSMWIVTSNNYGFPTQLRTTGNAQVLLGKQCSGHIWGGAAEQLLGWPNISHVLGKYKSWWMVVLLDGFQSSTDDNQNGTKWNILSQAILIQGYQQEKLINLDRLSTSFKNESLHWKTDTMPYTKMTPNEAYPPKFSPIPAPVLWHLRFYSMSHSEKSQQMTKMESECNHLAHTLEFTTRWESQGED